MWFHRCDQCGRKRLVDIYYEVYPPLGSEGDEAGWWWACADCLIGLISDRRAGATGQGADRAGRGMRYGFRWMGTWPHISLGVSAHVWPLKHAHLSLHNPFGVLILGYRGEDM
jgi:hypothetical protein